MASRQRWSASVQGLGWLPVRTVFEEEKVTRLPPPWTPTVGRWAATRSGTGAWRRWVTIGPGWRRRERRTTLISAGDDDGIVLGTTLHGLFEDDGFRHRFLAELAGRRGRTWADSGLSFAAARQGQIDRVADACEEHLDLDALWRLVESAALR